MNGFQSKIKPKLIIRLNFCIEHRLPNFSGRILEDLDQNKTFGGNL
jgi:hypothetical protein